MRAFTLIFALTAFGICAMSAAPAAATHATPVEACLDLAADDEAAQQACIGQPATECIDLSPFGETTAGMVRCADAERQQWEIVREMELSSLRNQESASQLALLNASLEEHRRWAEARCSYEASIYEGGSLSIVVAAQCMRNAVAEHALYLRNRYSER